MLAASAAVGAVASGAGAAMAAADQAAAAAVVVLLDVCASAARAADTERIEDVKSTASITPRTTECTLVPGCAAATTAAGVDDEHPGRGGLKDIDS